MKPVGHLQPSCKHIPSIDAERTNLVDPDEGLFKTEPDTGGALVKPL